MLLAGTDTTSLTTTMLLYHVARNPEVQTKILKEINKVLGENEEPTKEMLNSEFSVFIAENILNLVNPFIDHIPYTRAVVKESLRLNPVSIGTGRELDRDMEIHGYLVPKNVSVIYQP